ncbi:hypothetical protein J2Y45_001833 [Dyadobacter sp. BE34]|uniref:Uncharacterized protein n=1 Tax=Dyadobacter fermentans TaxID=94254 RepID=A0ABU1QW87_9BACT|nr:hypothetical protein [Dyadobacter fermentans]MDR7042305.1 hypothetical protein [Dyadobacter sp. BE242]MDR7196707.1 hypothetical protein [Dyadobacter sp. BE34]MDR7212748.1 hypothetical protein [Dyadobacter sp. BE31]MDR7262114.1 hypothetical protein [Dyadobacter sp. BE32]
MIPSIRLRRAAYWYSKYFARLLNMNEMSLFSGQEPDWNQPGPGDGKVGGRKD